MRKAGVIILAVLCLSTGAWAELPEYQVKRTTEKIVIDGILDEADWAAAQSVGDFKFPWLVEGEAEQTEVKILWDDTFFYISYRCDDKYIWADNYDTNSTTYKDDCVEIFWDPNPSDPARKYNMFEMNCIGNLLSVHVSPGERKSRRDRSIMVPHLAQTLDGTVNNDEDIDTGWILEVAVRFSDYTELFDGSTPDDGDMWRIGLNRLG